ncbi:MAG: hypothetical protein K0S39_1146 [Paenibacillus sp.]|jgi:putative aldouronate transport system substrate-binding protein|nr:hypothetical protein [Paenibacillus sp.]
MNTNRLLWKKGLPLLCSAALAMGAAGCQSGGAPKEETAKTDQPAAQKEQKPVTFSMFRNASYIVGYPDDGGPFKKPFLEAAAQAGIPQVDFKVSISGGQEYLTKLNVLAASNELPDYFSVDPETMLKFADEGLIMPLDDLMAKYAPNLTKLQNKDEIEQLRYKGKTWAVFPGYRPEGFNGPNTSGFNIRTDWLEGLGLKTPATLDELHEVLKAFTFNDPDKNGKKDTYGIGVTKTSGATAVPFDMVFGAFGTIPEYWVERDGKLKKGYTLPETKEALKVLRDWFKEGIIDPDFPVMQSQQVDEKVASSKLGVWNGSALDVNPNTPRYSALVKQTPNGKVGFLPPVTGPKGLKGSRQSSPGYGDLRAVSAKAKDPERLIKLIDWSADDSAKGGFWLATYGKEGEHYTFDKEKNLITQKLSYNDMYKVGFGNPVRFVQVVDRRWVPSEEARKAVTTANAKENNLYNAFWKTVPAEYDYPDLDKKLWPEYFLKIVLGQLPIEAWDEFVQKYYQQGGKKVEDQINEAYQKEKGAKK